MNFDYSILEKKSTKKTKAAKQNANKEHQLTLETSLFIANNEINRLALIIHEQVDSMSRKETNLIQEMNKLKAENATLTKLLQKEKDQHEQLDMSGNSDEKHNVMSDNLTPVPLSDEKMQNETLMVEHELQEINSNPEVLPQCYAVHDQFKLKTKAEFLCSKCGYVAKRKYTLQNHEKFHCSKSNVKVVKNQKCPICFKSYTHNGLRSHLLGFTKASSTGRTPRGAHALYTPEEHSTHLAKIRLN